MYLLLASEGAATGAEYALEQPDIIALNWLPAVTTIVVFLIAFGILYVKVWPTTGRTRSSRRSSPRRRPARRPRRPWPSTSASSPAPTGRPAR
jgi:hypothetical protein